MFKNCEFLFLNLDEIINKDLQLKKELETLVVQNGGNKVQNYLPNTTHVIAFKKDVRVNNILKKNDIDIYKPKWVQDCIKYKKLMPKTPFYLIHSSKESQNYFSKNYDSFGDSYYENVNKDHLREIFENIKIDDSKVNKIFFEDFNLQEKKNNKQNSEEISFLKQEEFNKILRELKEDFPNCSWIKNI